MEVAEAVVVAVVAAVVTGLERAPLSAAMAVGKAPTVMVKRVVEIEAMVVEVEAEAAVAVVVAVARRKLHHPLRLLRRREREFYVATSAKVSAAAYTGNSISMR